MSEPTTVNNFNANNNSNSQVNQGTVNNPTLNNYGETSEDLFEKLAAIISQTAAVNDIEVDQEQLDSVISDMQASYTDPDATEETAAPLVTTFTEYLKSYSSKLLPMVAKSALGLLAGAATGHPLLALLLTVMQDAVEA
jgi:hypothetical protein